MTPAVGDADRPGDSLRVRRALALVIEEPGATGRWLLVRRPFDDADLPGVWGLPAGSHAPGETDAALARRVGWDKLGVDLEPLGALDEGCADRPGRAPGAEGGGALAAPGGYRLAMRLLAARLRTGEPSVPQPVAGVTQYEAWRWGRSRALLDGAARGSLCCRLALDIGQESPRSCD